MRPQVYTEISYRLFSCRFVMNSILKLIMSLVVAGFCLNMPPAWAMSSEPGAEVSNGHRESSHHFSLLLAGTHIEEADHTSFTIGIDYEYRVNRSLGLGFVVEHAFESIDATTLIAVADIHIWEGLALQIGPGIEFVDEDSFFVGRIGALYEFELENKYTITPQLHYDFSHEDAVVFGVAFGRGF